MERGGSLSAMLFDLPAMPRVYNRHHRNTPPGAVYIGRGSPWGNPFVIGRDGDRATVIAKHSEWLLAQPEMVRRVMAELKGKNLECFCKPAACHGDLLLLVANFDPSLGLQENILGHDQELWTSLGQMLRGEGVVRIEKDS